MLHRAIVGCVLVLTFSVSQARELITVAGIEADLLAKGPKYVLSKYFDCGPNIGAGYALVERGSPNGVWLGATMLKYSDACVSEMLHSSLGSAMARAPSVVLPYVNTSPLLAAEKICLPFLSSDEPREKLRQVVTRARKTLLSVKGLEGQKSACLREIKEATLALR